MKDNELYPLYGATLEHAEWDEQGNLILHFRDERGFRHTLNVREKERNMESIAKSFVIYGGALLIIAVAVALVVGAV